MKRILVTRPEAQNSSLISGLKAQGNYPIAFPLLLIEVFNSSQHPQMTAKIQSSIGRLDEYQHFIFISTNAVEAAVPWLSSWLAQWLKNMQFGTSQYCYAIGDATAELMKKHFDFVEQSGTTMNSEGLLLHEKLQDLTSQKVLIFRGIGGRDYLKQELQKRGAQVDYCEVYQRQAISYVVGEFKQIFSQGIDVLTITSDESMQLLLEHATNDGIKDDVLKTPIVVPGTRLYGLAESKGFTTILQSENASLKAMLKACN